MYEHLSDEVIADAAFVAGILTGQTRVGLVPIPVKVDGLDTVAFCIKANPPNQPDRVILHPVFIVPHEGMLIQDRRTGTSQPLARATVMPLDTRHAKIYQAALANPDAFLGKGWGK